MSDLFQHIADLSPEKRELIELLLRKEGVDVFRLPIIPRKRETNAFPLSFSQERLWFLDQLEPGSPVYNLSLAVRLMGSLNVAALKQSLCEIVRRHETLRTTFASREGRPVQVIAPPRPLTLPLIDVSVLPDAERETEVQRLAIEQARRPFDLERGPLIRVDLLRLGEMEHVVLGTMHHIISDGWSLRVLLRELAVLYGAFVAGKPSSLSDLPIQYVDFAHWQRQLLHSEVLKTRLTYWKERLADAPLVLELPMDRSRPPVQTYRGARQSLVLSKALSGGLKALSRREGVTLFMTLLAAFQTLLHRYSGQHDIVVGSPIANRNRRELEGLIGFFVNMLALRTDLAGNPSFRRLLGRVREVTLGAYAHQDLPFELLVEAVQPPRDPSHTPLFQVMFMLQKSPLEALELPDARLVPFDVDARTAKCDLTLTITEGGDALTGSIEYNTDLFDASTIARMQGHFRVLLEGIVADPERRLSALPLLTETEMRAPRVRCELIDPGGPCSPFEDVEVEQSIPRRFEQVVQKYGGRIAVKIEDHELTYDALNRAVSRVAQAILVIRGAGAENIALLLEHDAAMIVGILAVLKTGKAYVPLDPSYPQERLSYITADSCAMTVVTNTRNLALAKTIVNGRGSIINIDEIRNGAVAEAPNAAVSPDSIAYLLYTSGSTGEPKGVVQNHRNVLYFIRQYTNSLYISADDRLTLLSSYSFDAAVMDIFGALLNGATLCLWNIKEKGLIGLREWLREEGITIYHSTPTVYRHFVGTLRGGEPFSKLRLIVLGGEAVYKRDVDLYKEHFPPTCILVNGFGPTESTLALQYFINKETEITRNAVSIGYPVEGTDVLLLDGAGEEASVYGIGEIAIQSRHVALEYWRKPELTRAAFREPPGGLGRRIYLTGDLGRRLPDGAIEYVGRKDFQVKVRGHRIEPAEIETALLEVPGVKEAVVVAREVTPADTRLVAYIVPSRMPLPGTRELQSVLKERLPDYMVPSAYVVLDRLPLTPTGKLDRRALPDSVSTPAEAQVPYVAPQTELERTIAELWQEVLRVKKVGIHDNFFDLGGHSLLFVQVHTRLRQILTLDLPLIAMFRYPTISSLSQWLSGEHPDSEPVQQSRRRAETRKISLRRQSARKPQRTAARQR